ncbi:MAG: hypothetical protein J5515_08725 [Lachnospiraceae bacterium]|jgi:hypothetical protein|nr:hypothetical protein [Lachnospiraceae bacterium]
MEEERNNSNILFYVLITIIITGLSILFAPRLINSVSSYIYKKQKPKVNVKFDKDYGPRIVKKRK